MPQAGAAGAEIFESSSLTPDAEGVPPAVLPAGTRLRVVSSTAAATVAGTAVHVQGLDDPSIDGWVVAGDLVPKDSVAPRVWGVEGGTARFSPNGDGVGDTATVTGQPLRDRPPGRPRSRTPTAARSRPRPGTARRSA